MKIDMPKCEDVSNERYFQICNCDARGCGSFYYFVVTHETPNEENMQIAADLHNQEMSEEERKYFPAIYNRPPVWRPTVKVKERKRTVHTNEKTGEKCNQWDTMRGGLKFKIVKRFTRMKTNLRTAEFKHYVPGDVC